MNLSKFKETRASADTNRNVKFTLAHGIGNLGSKLSTKIHAYTNAPKSERAKEREREREGGREREEGGTRDTDGPTKKKEKEANWGCLATLKNATPFRGS